MKEFIATLSSVPPVELLLSRLDKVKPNGTGKFLACCPAHADKSPSLSIKENPDGSVLIHCFAGCLDESVVNSVGLQLSDLFVPTSGFDRQAYARRKADEERRAKHDHNRLILSIAKSDVDNGKTLSGPDLKLVNAILEGHKNG